MHTGQNRIHIRLLTHTDRKQVYSSHKQRKFPPNTDHSPDASVTLSLFIFIIIITLDKEDKSEPIPYLLSLSYCDPQSKRVVPYWPTQYGTKINMGQSIVFVTILAAQCCHDLIGAYWLVPTIWQIYLVFILLVCSRSLCLAI